MCIDEREGGRKGGKEGDRGRGREERGKEERRGGGRERLMERGR